MNILLGISIIIIMSLYFRVINLKDKNKSLTDKNEQQKLDLSVYFNILIQYRDVIIKNNLIVPGTLPIIDKLPTDESYSIDGILDEIAEKGIDNISQDKLNFLKNNANDKK